MLTEVKIALCLLLIHVGPWCPFLIAAFYFHGWAKLILATIGIGGPILQVILLSLFVGVD